MLTVLALISEIPHITAAVRISRIFNSTLSIVFAIIIANGWSISQKNMFAVYCSKNKYCTIIKILFWEIINYNETLLTSVALYPRKSRKTITAGLVSFYFTFTTVLTIVCHAYTLKMKFE